VTRRQRAIAFFVTLCVLLVAAALALIVVWVISNAERPTPLVFGIISFALIIAGLIVYTVFLVLEIKRNEDHDTFINAVTHELKTPIASMRLYLQTRSRRRCPATRVLRDHAGGRRPPPSHVEQVPGAAPGQKAKIVERAPVDLAPLVAECVWLARVRHHLGTDAIAPEARRSHAHREG
jgi:signal transduction histidine kinase